ncbi:MAG: hypothetical protein LQ347_004651, partial [Umbilicaria vellea]
MFPLHLHLLPGVERSIQPLPVSSSDRPIPKPDEPDGEARLVVRASQSPLRPSRWEGRMARAALPRHLRNNDGLLRDKRKPKRYSGAYDNDAGTTVAGRWDGATAERAKVDGLGELALLGQLPGFELGSSLGALGVADGAGVEEVVDHLFRDARGM